MISVHFAGLLYMNQYIHPTVVEGKVYSSTVLMCNFEVLRLNYTWIFPFSAATFQSEKLHFLFHYIYLTAIIPSYFSL